MSDKTLIFSTIESLWKSAIENNRVKDALVISFIAYLETCNGDDVVVEKAALGLILESVFAGIQKMPSNRRCSFCGIQNPNTRLIGGEVELNVCICAACVDMLYLELHSNHDDKS